MSNHLADFRQAIEAAGLEAPDVIHDDGVLHRFGRGKSAYYVLHGDSNPAGMFGCWRAGLQYTWSAKPDNAMTPAEREAHKQRIQAMRAQREADESARQREEADKASIRWQAASTPGAHPYLARKGIKAHGIRQDGETLLIPLRDTAGKLHSLQTITPDGDKRFKGRMKGCYHAIGKPRGRIIVCEGYATGASIHEATGEAVAVAFNAGNLIPVATALHKAYPELVLLLAADDDHQTEANPGLSRPSRRRWPWAGLLSFRTSRQAGPTRQPTLMTWPRWPDWTPCAPVFLKSRCSHADIAKFRGIRGIRGASPYPCGFG